VSSANDSAADVEGTLAETAKHRLALVMNGAVSLAVWMRGVAYKVDNVRRALDGIPPRDGATTEEKAAQQYQPAGHLDHDQILQADRRELRSCPTRGRAEPQFRDLHRVLKRYRVAAEFRDMAAQAGLGFTPRQPGGSPARHRLRRDADRRAVTAGPGCPQDR
jgi:hypothetical protein